MDSAIGAAWAGVAVAFIAAMVSLYQAILNRRAIAVAKAAVPLPRPEFAWQLEPEGHGLYSLVNAGTKRATSVAIDPERSVGLTARPAAFYEILPGASVQLSLAMRWQGPRANDLWVSCAEQTESIPVRVRRDPEAS